MVFNKFHDFVERMAKGQHQFGTHVYKVMLTNSLPDSATDAVKADLTEIAAGNGYPAGGQVVTMSVVETGGVATLKCTSTTFTASGGAIPTFQYFVVYNDTIADKPLVLWADKGNAVNLTSNGDSIKFMFSASDNGDVFDLQ